jgi:hypothetical protein
MIGVRHTVEQDRGYESLTNKEDGTRTLRSESQIQITLKHWLEPKCKLYNIRLDREPRGGRGDLDFVFSIGHQLKCLVEVKLFDSAKLEHGLVIQLPTYLQADKANFGIYVPVILEPSFNQQKLDDLQSKVQNLNNSYDFEISIIDIRAWKPKSASRATSLDEPERYKI